MALEEKMKNRNIFLMEKESVGKALFFLAVPSVLAMLVQIIYGLTDAFFIGKLQDPNLMAAIALAMPFALLIQAIGNIFAIGGASYISRCLGEKKYDEAQHTSSVCFYFSAVSGFLLTAIFFIFPDEILAFLGNTEATHKAAKDYLNVLISCSFIQVLQVTLAGLIRSEGATKHAMIGIIVGTTLNTILDALFILSLGWGVAGAAWATVIGNVAGVIYYLYYFFQSKSLLSIRFKDIKPNKNMIREVSFIGFPSALNALIMSASHIITNNLAIRYGENVVAANGIMMRLIAIIFFIIMGLVQGYQPFAGYNFGAKNFKRLAQAFWTVTGTSIVIASFVCVIFYFWGKELFALFLNNEDVIQKGNIMLRAFLWAVPFFGIHFIICMTFQATGKALLAFILVGTRQCFLFLPLIYILDHLYGFQGFVFAQPISDVITTFVACGLLGIFFYRLRKKAGRNLKRAL